MTRTRQRQLLLALPPAAAFGLSLASCASLEVKPVEVKPIHITLDVNVRIDRELDQFFAFEDQPTTKPATHSTSTTAAAPATGAKP
jgi:hypothetical protein